VSSDVEPRGKLLQRLPMHLGGRLSFPGHAQRVSGGVGEDSCTNVLRRGSDLIRGGSIWHASHRFRSGGDSLVMASIGGGPAAALAGEGQQPILHLLGERLVAPWTKLPAGRNTRRLPAALPVSSTRSIAWCSTALACSGSPCRTRAVDTSPRITDLCFSLPVPRLRADSWSASWAPLGSCNWR
jgi:hypothetical protein